LSILKGWIWESGLKKIFNDDHENVVNKLVVYEQVEKRKKLTLIIKQKKSYSVIGFCNVSLFTNIFCRFLGIFIEFALLVNIYAPLKRLISKKSQFNPKQFVYNNVFSVQLPCLARHSLRWKKCIFLNLIDIGHLWIFKNLSYVSDITKI